MEIQIFRKKQRALYIVTMGKYERLLFPLLKKHMTLKTHINHCLVGFVIHVDIIHMTFTA